MRTSYVVLVALPVFVVIALLTSGSGFGDKMVLDSQEWLASKAFAFETESLMEVLKVYPPRPFAMMTFYLNYLVTGLDAHYFRVVNALILAASAAAVLLLIRIILDIPAVNGASTTGEKIFVASLASIAFLVHPVQSFAVLYVIQRMTLLACLFYVLSLTVYLATRLTRIRSQPLGYGLSYVLFLCGFFSKETVVTLPALVLMAEVLFFRRPLKISAQNLALLASLGILVLLPLTVLQPMPRVGTTGVIQSIGTNYQLAGLSFWQVVLSQCRITFDYVWLCVAPFLSHAPLVKATVFSRSLFVPPATLAAALGIVALVVIALLCARKRPLTSFGIGFFLIALIPEAVTVPQNLYFPQRATLSMVGFLVVAADMMLGALRLVSPYRSLRMPAVGFLAACAAVWLAATASTTVTRAALWKDPILVWKDSVAAIPESVRDLEKFPRSLALNGLGNALQKAGRPGEAIPLHKKALEGDPRDGETWKQLGTAYWQARQPEKALESFKQGLKLTPSDALLYNNAGAILFERKQFKEAIPYFREAVKLAPSDPLYRRHLAKVLLTAGDRDAAAAQLRQVIELQGHARRSASAHFELATILWESGKVAEAIDQMEKAVEIAPNLWQGHQRLGIAFARQGNWTKAQEHLQKALTLNPLATDVRKNLEHVQKKLQPSPSSP